MDLKELLTNTNLKPKERVEQLSTLLLNQMISVARLIEEAESMKDPLKASCIEALEHATEKKPEIADSRCLTFASSNLLAKAPRIKWESARVIGNIAHRFPEELELPVATLLVNTRHSGTVVRWSAAFALGRIIQLNLGLNKDLIPAVEAILNFEEKNSIKKIYLEALKKKEKHQSL
jgi:hypothetical protein